jgi:hypothetical protein
MIAWRAKALAVLEAACVMHLAGLTLHSLGLKRWLAWLDKAPAQRKSDLSAEQSVRLSASAVRWVERHSVFRWRARTNCLPRALTLSWLLARRSVPSQLRVGVRRDDRGALAAHAWVEVDGRPVNEPADVHTQFVAFDRSIQSYQIGTAADARSRTT